LGPSSAKIVPAATSSVRSRTASVRPYRHVRFDVVSAGSIRVLSFGFGFPLAADRVGDLRHIHTELFRLDDEPFDVFGDLLGDRLPSAGNRRGPPRRHPGTDAGLGFEQPPLYERRHHTLRRVRIDLQLLAERSNRREAIAGPELADDDGFADGEDDLVVKRPARAYRHAEGQHPPYYLHWHSRRVNY